MNEGFKKIHKDLEQLSTNIRNLVKVSVGQMTGSGNLSQKYVNWKNECMESDNGMVYRARSYIKRKLLLTVGIAALIVGMMGTAIFGRIHHCPQMTYP